MAENWRTGVVSPAVGRQGTSESEPNVMKSEDRIWQTHRYVPGLILGLYLLSSLIHFPSSGAELEGFPGIQLGSLAIALPRVLSGDSPHYVVAAHSLVEDLDFDLSNNYQQAESGDWDAGARFRGQALDHHTDVDRQGRELGTHSPFFYLLLAVFAWPFSGFGAEPVMILATLLAGYAGIRMFQSHALPFSDSWWSDSGFLLALATPLWCYSRDLWTEPWVMAIWVGLLTARSRHVLAILGFVGTLIKLPFVVVPLTMGLIALSRKRYRTGCVLIGASVAGVLTMVVLIQYLFSAVDHFSWFHSGVHQGFDLPLDGIVGLLLNPVGGLLFFFPFLAWGLMEFRKAGEWYLPAIVFFLVHASYQGWMGGTGFSARYLVPMLPVMVLAVRDRRPQSWVFKLSVVYSLFWGAVGGFFPALVYDRSPWGTLSHVLAKLWGQL